MTDIPESRKIKRSEMVDTSGLFGNISSKQSTSKYIQNAAFNMQNKQQAMTIDVKAIPKIKTGLK